MTDTEKRVRAAMSDIVERLRKAYGPDHTDETIVETLPLEAADEIERLRREVQEARADLEKHKKITEDRIAAHRFVLLRDIEAALNGDLGPIRNRRELMLLPPAKWVLSEKDRAP